MRNVDGLLAYLDARFPIAIDDEREILPGVYMSWERSDVGLYLTGLRSTAPGEGRASKALDLLLDISDCFGVATDLEVKPYGHKRRLGVRGLSAFYGRHGFRRCADWSADWRHMIRRAQARPAVDQIALMQFADIVGSAPIVSTTRITKEAH